VNDRELDERDLDTPEADPLKPTRVGRKALEAGVLRYGTANPDRNPRSDTDRGDAQAIETTSARAPAFVRSFRIGRYTCTIAIPHCTPGGAVQMTRVWHPELRRPLTAAELRQYRAGRDAALRELSELIGMRTNMVEL
jgi:hypothetical protein